VTGRQTLRRYGLAPCACSSSSSRSSSWSSSSSRNSGNGVSPRHRGQGSGRPDIVPPGSRAAVRSGEPAGWPLWGLSTGARSDPARRRGRAPTCRAPRPQAAGKREPMLGTALARRDDTDELHRLVVVDVVRLVDELGVAIGSGGVLAAAPGPAGVVASTGHAGGGRIRSRRPSDRSSFPPSPMRRA
jgi:hypothetical protein